MSSVVQYGNCPDGRVSYVKGVNLAGFVKVADVMLVSGLVRCLEVRETHTDGLDVVSRMDANADGALEPDEVSADTRGFLTEVIRDSGFTFALAKLKKAHLARLADNSEVRGFTTAREALYAAEN